MSDTPDHANRGHAEFSPSALKYIATCPGYKGKEGTSEAAERGTRIHEALEVRNPLGLQDEEEMNLYSQTIELEDEFLTQFNVEVPEEDHREIQLTVTLRWGLSTWGTCDRLILVDKATAVMVDYKTGISDIDPPQENYQAMAYTLGAFQRFPEIERLIFAFIIPARGCVSQHEFCRSDMADLQENLTSIVREATRVRPSWEQGTPSVEDLRPSQYCRFCAYEGEKCPALGGLVKEVVRRVAPELPDVDFNDTEDPEALEVLYSIARIMEAWVDKTKSRAVALAKEGLEFPTLRLRSMGATNRAVNPIAFIEEMKKAGVDTDEILQAVSLPVAKMADLAAEKASAAGVAKNKATFKKLFLDHCSEEGIIAKDAERFTLK